MDKIKEVVKQGLEAQLDHDCALSNLDKAKAMKIEPLSEEAIKNQPCKKFGHIFIPKEQ